jgi:hypothetical protein
VPHDDAIHAAAHETGDFSVERLFEGALLSVSLLHFADDTHGVRLDFLERGLSLVLDTPAWLDLDTVLPEVMVAEPTLSSGYVIVEREEAGREAAYRVTVQGGDVVGRVSVIMVQSEIEVLRAALQVSREQVESADELDHQSQPFGNGLGST